MSKKIIIAISLSLLSTSVFAALAQSSGFYAEANAGIRNSSNAAFTAYAGYKFNNNVAFEAGAAILDKPYILAAAKIMFPFDNGFSVFGKAGITQHVDFYGAAGVGYAFTPNWSASVQGLFINHDSGQYAATLGLTYLFPSS